MMATKKFAVTCKENGILDENERIRREKEEDLRKLRILQVREESKNMARKIREDVAAEKDRQLRQLETKKTQELHLWRNSMLREKYDDYRDAIFCVGEAHRAAKNECKRQQALDALKKEKRQNICWPKKQKENNVQNFCAPNNKNVSRMRNVGGETMPQHTNVSNMSPCSVYDGCSCRQYECPHRKRKRNPCEYSHVTGCYNYNPYAMNMMDCYNINMPYHCVEDKVTTESCDTDSLLVYPPQENDDVPNSAKSSKLCKTPTVCMEVENDTSAKPFVPGEINDRHVKNNRQFTHVVRPTSPAKAEKPQVAKKTPIKKALPKKKPAKIPTPRKVVTARKKIAAKTAASAATASSAATAASSAAVSVATAAAADKAANEQQPCIIQTAVVVTQKQFTQISDYLRQQEKIAAPKAVDKDENKKEPERACTPSPRISRAKSDNEPCSSRAVKSAPCSPSKTQRSSLKKQPCGPTASVKSATTLPSSTTTSSGCVQFFDYKTKQTKEAPPKAIVQRERVCQTDEPNAMERANMEKEQQKARDEELDKLRKRSDERGQRALEREQVRREATELTAKLDALTREHPHLLPTEASLYDGFHADEIPARREKRATTAVEELLMRPAIITCPEVNRNTRKSTAAAAVVRENNMRRLDSSINLAAPANGELTSSESSHSILLGHVNYQSKQIRNDLQNCAQVDDKQKICKLQALLGRTNKVREMLMNELSRGLSNVSKSNMEEIVDCLCNVRKEREHLVAAESVDNMEISAAKTSNTKSKGEIRISKESIGQPLEIIIKVQGVNKAIKPHVSGKTASKKPNDSNSTSYNSLPNKISSYLDKAELAIAARDGQKQQTLHPELAQYVKRLLGMSKESIGTLAVSESDIETPNSSVMNIPTNLSAEHLKRVQKLIDDNHSFVNEMEQTLQTQAKQTARALKERPLREVWQERLEKETAKARAKQLAVEQAQQTISDRNDMDNVSKQKNASNEHELAKNMEQKVVTDSCAKSAACNPLCPNAAESNKITGIATTSKQSADNESRAAVEKNFERYAQLTENCTQRVAELTDLINRVRAEKDRLIAQTLSTGSETYPNNSTEYYELPSHIRAHANANAKVNVNANAKASAHANANESTDNSQSKLLDSNLVNDEDCFCTDAYQPHTESSSLNKYKVIAASHDSGIAMSRPLTALEQHADMLEPTSLPLNSQRKTRTHSHPPPPPLSLSRLSPELTPNECHELSTILEVDTPVNSRINTTAAQNAAAECNCSKAAERVTPHAPNAFPTFEEYLLENNLNLAELNPEISAVLQHEFNELVSALQMAQQNNDLVYEEFPSLTAYLHNLTAIFDEEYRHCNTSSSTGNSIDEMIASMRLAKHKIKQFPNRREYFRQQQHCDDAAMSTDQFIDSNSLNNVSLEPQQAQLDSQTESLDIEGELIRRRIIRSYVACSPNKRTNNQQVFCSTIEPNNGNTAQLFQQIMACESGIEKLTTTDNDDSEEFERELKNIGLQWPAAMRRKCKAAEALSSGSSPEPQSTTTGACKHLHCDKAQNKSQKCLNNSCEAGQPLNLREFLTKELLKHVNSSSSSAADDTLRNQFFHSIIDSMTPTTPTTSPTLQHNPVCSSNTVGRKKTSTPVSATNTNSQSEPMSTNSHLFSGESHLSSVPFTDISNKRKQQQQEQQQ